MKTDRSITKAVSVLVEIIGDREVRPDGIVAAAFHNLGRFGRHAKSRLDLLTRIVTEEPQWAIPAIDAIGSIMEDVLKNDEPFAAVEEVTQRITKEFNDLVEAVDLLEERIDDLEKGVEA